MTALGVFVGLATFDVVHRVVARPEPNKKVTALRQDVSAGGPAANAAVTFAALGGRARLITALGSSAVAQIIRTELERYGVEVVDTAPEVRSAPGVSAVTIVEGSDTRAIVSHDAVAVQESLGHEVHPPDDLGRWLDGADVLLVDGHHPEVAVAAVNLARKAAPQPLVVLDAGRWRPVMYRLLPDVDVAICSADFRMPSTVDIASSAAVMRGRGVPLVATTDGAAPVHWWTASGEGKVPVPTVTARDTLGAGDVFHGAYAWYALQSAAQGLPPDRALPQDLAHAARIAALRCSVMGPRDWMDRLPSVLGPTA